MSSLALMSLTLCLLEQVLTLISPARIVLVAFPALEWIPQ